MESRTVSVRFRRRYVADKKFRNIQLAVRCFDVYDFNLVRKNFDVAVLAFQLKSDGVVRRNNYIADVLYLFEIAVIELDVCLHVRGGRSVFRIIIRFVYLNRIGITFDIISVKVHYRRVENRLRGRNRGKR